jgi:hypothetical protein
MHRHTLKIRAEAALDHLAVRLVPRQIHPSFQMREAPSSGQQPIKLRCSCWSRLYRAKFHIALLVSGLGAGTIMADRESDEMPILPEQHGLARAFVWAARISRATSSPAYIVPVTSRQASSIPCGRSRRALNTLPIRTNALLAARAST